MRLGHLTNLLVDETAYQADNTKGWNCINADDYTWDSENETWVGIVV